MPYNKEPLNVNQVELICDVMGAYAEIDGDRMYAQFFCNVTGDHLGTARIA